MYSDPFAHFQNWYQQALSIPGLKYPQAMVLSTFRKDGFPDGRVVLLKGLEKGGFVFYTNTLSSKGSAMAAHSQVGLTFYWQELGFQVRVLGVATPVSEAEADTYFKTRPRESKLGAWASSQSQPLDSRESLEKAVQHYAARFPDEVPRPPYWSGYRIVPKEIEFWHERPFRLHDRWRYIKTGETWTITRLNP